jgi:hypothetical protein
VIDRLAEAVASIGHAAHRSESPLAKLAGEGMESGREVGRRVATERRRIRGGEIRPGDTDLDPLDSLSIERISMAS